LRISVGIGVGFITVSGGGSIRVLTVSIRVSFSTLGVSVSIGLRLIAISGRGGICVLTVGVRVSVLLSIVAAVVRLRQLEVHVRLFKRVLEVGNPAHASVSGATGNNTDGSLTLVNGTAGVTLLREHTAIGIHLETVDDPITDSRIRHIVVHSGRDSA